MSINVNIQLDKDGYIELKCNYCNEKFMLKGNDYNDNYEISCPNCGLHGGVIFSDSINNYISDKISNFAIDRINDIFSGNKNKIFHFDKIKKLYERDVRYNNNRLDIIHLYCCNKDIKIDKLFSVLGLFCPFCKGRVDDIK